TAQQAAQHSVLRVQDPGTGFMRHVLNLQTGEIIEDASRSYAHDPAWRTISTDECEKIRAWRKRKLAGLATLKNKHAGQTIHVFGGGPSLNEYAANADWTGKITIGVNGTPRIIRPLVYWLRIDDLQNSG